MGLPVGIGYFYQGRLQFVHGVEPTVTVLKIKKNSRLSVCQRPGNQTPDFGCPDENLVVLQGCP